MHTDKYFCCKYGTTTGLIMSITRPSSLSLKRFLKGQPPRPVKQISKIRIRKKKLIISLLCSSHKSPQTHSKRNRSLTNTFPTTKKQKTSTFATQDSKFRKTDQTKFSPLYPPLRHYTPLVIGKILPKIEKKFSVF